MSIDETAAQSLDVAMAVALEHETLGNWQATIEQLDSHLSTQPKNPDFYLRLANALRAEKDSDRAQSVLDTGLDICASPRMFIMKGKLLRDKGRYENAIECYNKAIELNLNFAEAYCQKGIVLDLLGETDSAISAYNEALRLDRENGLYWLCAAKADFAQNNPSSAKEKLEKAKNALNARQTENHHYNMACIESLLGNIDLAVGHFENFLSNHPFAFSWAEQDSDLAPIRNHPRMKFLKEKYRQG